MDNEFELFKTPTQRKNQIIATVVTVVLLVIIAFMTAVLLKTYVISTIPVGGDSMLPTLHGGQYVTDGNGHVTDVVSKGDTLVLTKVGNFKKGDIVVFDVSWQVDPIVKRIIATEGDHVEINNDGIVYVNGTPLDEDYTQGATYTADGITPLSVVVPEGHVFCLGDNRENSHDSRHEDIGVVNINLIRGKCFIIVSKDGGLKFV